MKIVKTLLLFLIFVFLIISLFLFSNSIINSMKLAIELWANKVVPSLLPFLLLTPFLVNYGLIEILSELLKPLTNFFKMNSNSIFIIVMGLFSGSPSNAVFAKEAINNGLISDDDATKALMFSHFASPLFILGTVYLILKDYKICILILFITYITNFILAFFFRNKYVCENSSTISFNNIKKKLLLKEDKPIGKILSCSIKSTFDTLIIILGSISFFFIISTIIQNIINLSDFNNTLLSGILEMTQGINKVFFLKIPLKIKTILITIFLSFGGLSIHSQILSVISDTKIKYLPYLFARILHAFIAGLLVFILFDYIS